MEAVTSVQVRPSLKAGPRAWALVAVIGLQVAVPAVMVLAQEEPARFAFTMYSGQGHVDVVIEAADGTELPFDPTEVIAGFRPELSWYDHLPAYLCSVMPQAHVVTVSQKGHESRVTCD